jgi:hypothetical protein
MYKCKCGARFRIAKWYSYYQYTHKNCRMHQDYLRSLEDECFICAKRYDKSLFRECEQCHKTHCLHCYSRILNGQKIRCPFCRHTFEEGRPFRFSAHLELEDDDMPPLEPIPLTRQYGYRLPNFQPLREFVEAFELAADSIHRIP